jgi:hypothetical protein
MSEETLEEMAPGPNGLAARCKTPGCDGEALSRLGMYGGLCAEHKAAKQNGRGRKVLEVAAVALSAEPGRLDLAPVIVELRDELTRTQQHADRLLVAITALEALT